MAGGEQDPALRPELGRERPPVCEHGNGHRHERRSTERRESRHSIAVLRAGQFASACVLACGPERHRGEQFLQQTLSVQRAPDDRIAGIQRMCPFRHDCIARQLGIAKKRGRSGQRRHRGRRYPFLGTRNERRFLCERRERRNGPARHLPAHRGSIGEHHSQSGRSADRPVCGIA